MIKLLMFVLLVSIALFVAVGCSQATPEPAAMPEGNDTAESAEMSGMEHKMGEEDMAEEAEQKMDETGMEHGAEAHQTAHGGQVGMAAHALKSGADIHLEFVSDAPGQYILYLSDNNREPISPEDYKGSVAVIKPDGSEIASMPFMVMADHLRAEGGPTDEASQLDVRVTIEGPDLVDIVEMDFTLLYEE
jgi:hypothetical protein